ncbi:phosphopantothenoylcysteine decarboxylase/phosphopantothenate--cysteine ligase [Bernardetia litoralis DSM 6794]|uniref:Coenzyme A biosynthesis bifunctional protein CoaBC n=1 Tax=Bernardetia litoralis (strain ATCC 23117 / DSM 6794 / NBRC 15988 / NCIMB 1366 / Fx l1 / Sio-4) TaxID=880071 RepID=I4AKP9_BERLS|nr:bifunctional phosphopantothenoylcysteine decarboxylase/phosphopantothenate--cysteine ligase CoaBC [Bernardetia litoralis]AFM04534.1 phosphopantothenoylcysteine decarboxylase/phosphopantothenate--cysteine ligase [Bernardetia litoralis DSM 6794]
MTAIPTPKNSIDNSINHLQNKKILLGVCGSISAYKSALLVRLLVKQNCEVQVIMTKSATDFITPLTLATLSKKPVLIDFIKNKEGIWNNHVELGLWADAFIIAPASENTIAKLANGLCDNLLSATYLSARCPVFVAPAMDLDMYQHPATLRNLEYLKSYENILIEATHGELASGLVGQGRLEEPENIIAFLNTFFKNYIKKEANIKEVKPSYLPLKGKKITLTAGATREAIDPVRYLTNHSSGKMGYAIAKEAQKLGAEVTLISTSSLTNPENVNVVKIASADEMLLAVDSVFQETDIFIFAAAVADYRPLEVATQKIKKEEGVDKMVIELTKNPDIAATIGAKKQSSQFLVGFALETNNELENAQGKLKKKNLDMIVLNSLQEKGAGFGHDTNKISIIDSNKKTDFELKSKTEVAKDILKTIIDKLELRKNPILEKEEIEKPISIKKFEINKKEEF